LKFSELHPQFVQLNDVNKKYDKGWFVVDTLEQADGIIFLCPKCLQHDGSPIGTHSIVCWRPHVPMHITPGPGRWQPQNGEQDFDKMTFEAWPSSSVLLQGGCNAHFFINHGEVQMCG
jgi:hypothetical protein